MSTFNVSFPGLGINDFTIDRIAFKIGEMPIYWYGILIATGMLLAIIFAFVKAKSFGIDSDRMIDVIFIGTVFSIICARAYYVVFELDRYNSFADIINIRDGGVAIYGAVIGAAVSGYFACKWRKVRFLPMLDLAAIGFLIGQGIGRWGNFMNQEAFGTNTTAPWGMISEGTTSYLSAMQQSLAAQGIIVDPSMPVHPTFLYESIWCILGFFALWAYSKHRKFDGEISLMYLAIYGAERAVVEGFRTDSLMWGPVRVSQALAAVTVVVAAVLLIRGYKKTKIKLANGEVCVSNEITLEEDTARLKAEKEAKLSAKSGAENKIEASDEKNAECCDEIQNEGTPQEDEVSQDEAEGKQE